MHRHQELKGSAANKGHASQRWIPGAIKSRFSELLAIPLLGGQEDRAKPRLGNMVPRLADIPRLFPIPHLESPCAKDLKDRPKRSVVKGHIVERKSLIKEREPMVQLLG